MPSQPIDTGWGFNAVIDLIESDFDVASPTLSTASTVKPNDGLLGPPMSDSGSLAGSALNSQSNLHLGDFTRLFGELGYSSPLPPVAPASPIDLESHVSSDDAILFDKIGSSSSGEHEDQDSPLAELTAKQQKQARKKAAKKERKTRKALIASTVLQDHASSVNPVTQTRNRSNVGAKIRPATPTPEVQPDTSKLPPPMRILQFPRAPPDPVDTIVPSQLSDSLVQPCTLRPAQFSQTNFLPSSHAGSSKSQVKQLLRPPSLSGAKPSSSFQPQVPSSLRLNHGLVPRTVQPIRTPRGQNVSSTQTYYTPPQRWMATSCDSTSPKHNTIGITGPQSTQNSSYTSQTQYQIFSPTGFTNPVYPTATPGATIYGLKIRSQTERHCHLFNQLLANFPEDAHWLVSPMPLTKEEIAARGIGIHCFIDASNIMIGFKDMLRRHGLRQLELSFESLALLMERRRPVAKRIYAGSHREAAPFPHAAKLAETSKAVGYESLVKEQVFIRRDDSERKKFFKDVERMGWTKALAHRTGSGSDSETGPAAPSPLSPPKWVEQGVDEILHLKMCQSIIDTQVPTTMVLATGDGNAAEFSDGFLANVERALRSGWTVELVSWRQQMSGGYRNKKFRTKWGDRFRVVELDDYLESLIDML